MFVFFWGDAWQHDPQAPLVQQVNAFFDYVLTSPLIDQMAANGEIGDICAWQTKRLGDYTVQLEWSNRAGSCV